MKYSLRFSEEAKAASFKDKTSFDDLPADLLFKIELPKIAPTKSCSGVAFIECEALENYKNEYPFTFSVTKSCYKSDEQIYCIKKIPNNILIISK